MAQREQKSLPTIADLLVGIEDDKQPVLTAELQRNTGEAAHPAADLIARQAGAADVDQHAGLATSRAGAGGRLFEDRQTRELGDARAQEREGGCPAAR